MAMSAESKAGAFFLISLVLLGLFTFKVGDFSSWWQESYVIRASFKHARELKENDPVAVSGVRVGQVLSLSLHDDRVVVYMKIGQGVVIHEGAVARIVPSGLLGTKYVDISNGPATMRALINGNEIRAEEGIDVGVVLQKIDSAVGELGKFFSDESKDNIGKLINNMTKVSEDLAQGKGTIGRLIADDEMYRKLDTIASEFVETAQSVKKIVKGNEENINKIIANISDASPEVKNTFAKAAKLVEQIQSGDGLLPKLINDKAMYEDARATLKSVREFAAKLEKGEGVLGEIVSNGEMAQDARAAVKDFRAFAAKLGQGKGLIQDLLTDEKTAEDGKAAIRDFRLVAADVRKAVAGVQEFIDRVNKGQGTLQLLLTDRSLYDEVRQLVGEAKDTARGLREQIPVGTFTGLLISAF